MWRYAYHDRRRAKNTKITWALVRRVLSYASPTGVLIAIGLILILIQSGIGLLTPLIFRDLIDHTLPSGDASRLNVLALRR